MKEIESVEEFIKLVEEKDKIFVDFYADWCAPCKLVEPEVKKLAEEVKDVEFVKVNIDKVKELASYFNIQAIPTFVMIVNRKYSVTIGAKDRKSLKAWIEDVINKVSRQ